jgi:molybdopterin molybdotransferase
MTQLSDDCFAFGGRLMSLDEALQALSERTGPVVESQEVPLSEAIGRVLAEDVFALTDVPVHDNAAVDGFAFRCADLALDGETRLAIAGRAAAGHPLAGPVPPRSAVRIFTGAAMPDDLDTVAMQEDCRVEGDVVAVPPGLKAGANRRRAGEDVRAGARVLAHGRRLRPQDIGLAAAAGCARLTIHWPLRVAVFSTGDELIEPGTPPAPGWIYDSNRYALMALLHGLGCDVVDLGILKDRLEDIREALADAAPGHDLIITSGGMSVGEEDHVKAAVEDLGSLHFWQLAIKPGRPIGLGQVAGKPFIGLPGNPVAMIVTFLRIARPMILRLMGCRNVAPTAFTVASGFAWQKKAGRREWLRAWLIPGAGGRLEAQKFAREGSGILSSLVEADGLVELPEDVTRIEPGTPVAFLPFSEMG